jgi:methyltransferase-like protein
MMHDSYDRVPYLTKVHFDMHPDRLAAVGRLAGMAPAPVDGCRYLEIGCGNGAHSISLAHYLPNSTFVGVDLAEVPIAQGDRIRCDLNLENLTLRAGDLRDISEDWGEFDYIAAHGVYSWAPPEVRDALLRVCRERLAPEGIAFISFNALPGRRARQYLQDLMRFHTRAIEDPEQRVSQARQSVGFLLEKAYLPDQLKALLAKDAERIAAMPDSQLFHDDLAAFSDPIYFSDFVAAASRHRLQYVGEADTPEMFDLGGLVKDVTSDLLEREQYMDFLKARMFRQTLLCRAERELPRPRLESCFDSLSFTSLTRTMDDGQIQGLRGILIKPVHDAARNVSAALGEMYPLPISFEELAAYAGSNAALRDILTGMVMSGFADIHVHDFPFHDEVTERPQANRLVRYLARDSSSVVNACCRTVNLDPVGRQLVQLLDGARSHEKIAADLSRLPNAPPLEAIVKHLPDSLQWMARAALLEA